MGEISSHGGAISGQGESDLAQRAFHVGLPTGGASLQNSLLSGIEARLTGEVLRLVFVLRESARILQSIGEEIPASADCCKLVASTLQLTVLQFANGLAQSCKSRIF